MLNYYVIIVYYTIIIVFLTIIFTFTKQKTKPMHCMFVIVFKFYASIVLKRPLVYFKSIWIHVPVPVYQRVVLRFNHDHNCLCLAHVQNKDTDSPSIGD